MIKFFLRLGISLLIILSVFIIYLNFVGIKTNRFDNLIKNKTNQVNKYVKLEFQETKIYLNLKELNLVVKLQNPNVLIAGNFISLSKLDLFLSIKSFFSSDFLLKRAEVSFVKNDIKDLTKITNIFLPKIINKQLNKIFTKGNLEGEFIIPFKPDGSIGKDYGFTGKVYDASIRFSEKIFIDNLAVEIKNLKLEKTTGIEILAKNGFINNIQLKGTKINLRRDNDKIRVESFLKTKGKLKFSDIKNISNLFNFNLNNYRDINGEVDLKINVDFLLEKYFTFKNLSYSIEGDIPYCEISTDENNFIKEYFPEYNSKYILKNNTVKLTYSKSKYLAKISGFSKVNDGFDSFDTLIKYNPNNNFFSISGNVDLTNSKVKIFNINYIKDKKIKSKISFALNFIPKKYYNINHLYFSAEKNKVNLSKIKLNKNFELNDFNKIVIKTFVDKNKNNDFKIENKKKIIITGEVFDAEPLLKSLYKKSDKKLFSKKFSKEIKINFDKTITGTNDDIFNFSMIASIYKGSYVKLSSKGIFSEEEIIEMSIYKDENNNKTIQVVSDRARPFVKNYDFIKGFEGGKLEYESSIVKNESSSNLIITDFKVSKVPALAKLLTLASLRGIADTLSGEGIRFDSFEMKTISKGNVLNIEDALAMGPAVSILLNGYVDKGKTVSLRGTLVPATKLNSIISTIPLVGDILVGKKTGEGVVGVSFKMKGPPKDIKTTVNPIKTLTPRFIVRAVEKMKKKKKEEAK